MIIPAVVSSVRFDAATLLAVSDLLSLLSPLQYLLLCRTLSGDHSLTDKEKKKKKKKSYTTLSWREIAVLGQIIHVYIGTSLHYGHH